MRRSRLACPQVLRAAATEGRRHPRRCRCSPCAPSLLFSHTAVTAASFISGLLPGKRYELRVSKNRSLGALGESTTAGAVSPELERLGGKQGEIISPSCRQVSSDCCERLSSRGAVSVTRCLGAFQYRLPRRPDAGEYGRHTGRPAAHTNGSAIGPGATGRPLGDPVPPSYILTLSKYGRYC